MPSRLLSFLLISWSSLVCCVIKIKYTIGRNCYHTHTQLAGFEFLKSLAMNIYLSSTFRNHFWVSPSFVVLELFNQKLLNCETFYSNCTSKNGCDNHIGR